MKNSAKPLEKRQFPLTESADERERQLISLAVDRAEQQLRDGTASSQVICHYLKLGSTRERLEKEIMEEHKELLKAKTDAIKAAKRAEELFSKALDAMRAYSGHTNEDDDFE